MTYIRDSMTFTEKELSEEKWLKLPQSITDSDVYVSSLGRIKRLKKDRFLITLGSFNKQGYMRTSLMKNKKQKDYKIHRLVCMMFLEGLTDDLIVNHKNNIKNDNRLVNLEITTHRGNVRHYHSKFNNKKYSKIVGVKYHKGCDRWGFNESGMCFKTKKEAEEAYKLFKKGLFQPTTQEERFIQENKDRILDVLFLLENGFLIKQIKKLTNTSRETIRRWERDYKSMLPNNYSPVLFKIEDVEKEVFTYNTGKDHHVFKQRVGREFINRVGEKYTVIKEVNDICTIQFSTGEIIENIKWERLRRARTRKPKNRIDEI